MNRIRKPKIDFPSTLNHHPNDILSRDSRAPTDDKFAKFVNHMESISRIVNGMSLQSSMVSENVHVDDVIKQLIPAGSFPLQNLNGYKSEVVTAAMENYGKLSKKLEVSDDLKKAEAAMLAKEKIRKEVLEIGDVENLPGMAEYEGNLKTIKISTGIQVSDVDTIIENITSLKKSLSAIKDMNPDSVEQQFDPTFVSIVEAADRLAKSFASFAQNIKLTDGVQSTDLSPNFMNPLFKHIELQKKYKSMNFEKTGNTGQITGNLDTLKSVTAVYKSAEVQFSLLEEFLTSRNTANDQTIVHVAGFPNGVKDLLKLSEDAGKEWLRRAANGTESFSESFKNAFAPLEKLTKELDDVDKKLVNTEEEEAVRKMHEVVKWLAEEHVLNKAFETVSGCNAEFREADGTDETQMKTMREDMDTLETIFTLNARIGELKKRVALKETDTEKNNKETRKLLKDLKDSPFVKETMKQLENMHTLLTNMKTSPTELTDLVERIQEHMKTVEALQKTIKKSKYAAFFNCLRTAQDTKVSETIEMIRNIRNGMEKGTGDVVKSLLKSLGHLQSARKIGENMKTVKDRTVRFLMSLQEEVPSDLAGAADGFRKIKELIEKRSEVEPLMEVDVKSVVESAKKFQKELHPVHFNLLKSIEKLKKSIIRMFDGISRLQKVVDQFESKSLRSNGMVFDAADDIFRVSDDFGLWVVALESLNGKDPDLKIPGVVGSLRTLRNINFDVADHRFSNSKHSLADLDLFFASFSEEISPPYYQHYVPLPTKKRHISYEPRPEPDRKWALYVYTAALALSLLIIMILFFTWTEPEDETDSEDNGERVTREQRRKKRRRLIEIFAE